MKVGLFIGAQHPAGVDMVMRADETVAQVRAARDAGFDSVWLAQHLLTGPDQFLQPLPLLSRLIPETGTMQIGTALLLLPLVNPVMVAEDYATVDVLSGGRLVLGVGLGYRDEEYSAFGVEKPTRAQRFEESIQLLRRLWTEESVNFDGDFYQLSDARIAIRPVQQPHPPIWIGCAADVAVRRAARLGDAWLATNMSSISLMERQRELYDDERAVHGLGAPADVVKIVETVIGMTPAEQEPGLTTLEAKYETYLKWGMGDNVPGGMGSPRDIWELGHDRFLLGDPETVVKGCLEHQKRLGLSHLILRVNFPGMSHTAIMRSIELLGTSVLKEVRDGSA